MQSFEHIAPALRLFSGPDSLALLGRELDRVKAKRAMVLCGTSIGRRPALLELVRQAMGERCAGVFTGVQAHSPLPAVEAAAEALRQAQADAAVAVGGGSAVVTARAASILLAEKGDAHSLSTSRDAEGRLRSPKLLAPKIPLFLVPTTPNTALSKAGSAAFEPATGERLALFDPKTRAQAIFFQPDMLASAPRALVMSASLNAFVQAIEGLLSTTGDPIADALLMHALRLLAGNMTESASEGGANVRTELAVAALMCGQGTDHTGVGVTTVLGHGISARFGVDNGIAKAIILPHALRFNAAETQPGLARLIEGMGLSRRNDHPLVEAANEAVERVCTAVGAPRRLREVGVPQEALPDIAVHAMSDWFLRGNPRRVRDPSELEELLAAAW